DMQLMSSQDHFEATLEMQPPDLLMLESSYPPLRSSGGKAQKDRLGTDIARELRQKGYRGKIIIFTGESEQSIRMGCPDFDQLGLVYCCNIGTASVIYRDFNAIVGGLAR